MVPAWLLALALLAGAAAGWFLRGWLGRRRTVPAVAVQAVEEPVAEPALKMEAVLTELERRYQGRVAEPESGKTPTPRRRRSPKSP